MLKCTRERISMSLSTMQEIFLLLEDEKEVPFYRLDRWGRPARGALAKLKSLGFITKTAVAEEAYYMITPKGESYLDDVLDILKSKESWDKKWRLVMFEIPEKNRALRDKLRRELTNMGLGLLQSSVWISPTEIKDKVNQINLKLEANQQIKYFEVQSNPSIDKQIVEKSWNIPAINLEMERFVKDATWQMKAMGKGNGDRYNAKKLIFEYALILKKTPVIPEVFLDKNEIRKNAHELYLKLRKIAQ